MYFLFPISLNRLHWWKSGPIAGIECEAEPVHSANIIILVHRQLNYASGPDDDNWWVLEASDRRDPLRNFQFHGGQVSLYTLIPAMPHRPPAYVGPRPVHSLFNHNRTPQWNCCDSLKFCSSRKRLALGNGTFRLNLESFKNWSLGLGCWASILIVIRDNLQQGPRLKVKNKKTLHL